MSFITPMLAAPMPKTPLTIAPGKYAVEEKFDGHRLVVRISNGPTEYTPKETTAWSRDGRERYLPPHVYAALQAFPNGVYDGELMVPGGRSHNVTELTKSASLVYMVFDVLELLGTSTIAEPWFTRRAYLEEIFNHLKAEDDPQDAVRLSKVTRVSSLNDVNRMMADMLAADREGLILKRVTSKYSPGKRPKEDWIKLKGLRSAVLRITGFQASRGTIQNRGAYAVVELMDEEGNQTTVKTLDDAQCRAFEAEATEGEHPAIGRQLRIEYQERTEDGLYRHPRWDRWENE